MIQEERRIYKEEPQSSPPLTASITPKTPFTLNLKDVVIVIGTVISITLSWANISTRMALLEEKILQQEKQIEKLEEKYEKLRERTLGGGIRIPPP